MKKEEREKQLKSRIKLVIMIITAIGTFLSGIADLITALKK